MSTGHEFRALVLAAAHLFLLFLITATILSAFDVGLGQTTMTPDPHYLSAGAAAARMTCAPRAGVSASVGPFDCARGFAFSTVRTRIDKIVILHLVTITLTAVVTASQLPMKQTF